MLAKLFWFLAVVAPAAYAQVASTKPDPNNNCGAVVSSLAEQAEIATSTALPRGFVPWTLYEIGYALAGCSFQSAKNRMLSAFEAARTLNIDAIAPAGTNAKSNAEGTLESDVRESQRRTLVAVIGWLVSSADKQKRPELLAEARALAAQINFREKAIARQEAFEPILNALLAKHDNDATLELLSEIEAGDGASPTGMLLRILQADTDEELKSNVLQRGNAAVENGQCGAPSDLQLISKLSELQGPTQIAKALRECIRHRKNAESPTATDLVATQRAEELLLRVAPETASERPATPSRAIPSAPANSGDLLPQAYEDIQKLAEESSAAVAMRVAQIPDPQTRQALLTSAQSALAAAGRTEAAARVAAIISSMPASDGSDQRPVELIMKARSTTTGDALRVQVSHALASAEKILAAESKAFSSAPNERERVRLYTEFSDNAVVAYLYAAESAFDLALESAQRVVGPKRAEVLAMILTVACENRPVRCTESFAAATTR